MFRGQFEHAMDAKGRISLPSRFRDALARSGDTVLIVTPSLTDACLDVFPLKRWETFEARVAELPRFDENVIKLRRLYVSAAVECEVDTQGRVLVPQALRDRGKLDKAVVWAGMVDKAELWSAELWSRASTPAPEDKAFLRAIASEMKL